MILQLLAATGKTGQLEVRADDAERRGSLGVSEGRLVSAQYEDEDGYLALGAVFAIDGGDFEFLPQDRVEGAGLGGDIEELLERAKTERGRVLAVREVIPTDRVRFRLSERATERGQITLGPVQWRALLFVDGQRDVAALAERLQTPRPATRQLLAELVRAGLVDPVEPPAVAPEEAPRPYRRLPPMQPIPPTQEGERVVLRGQLPDFPLGTILQLLAETKKTGRLEVRAGRDSSTLGVSDGRLVSASSGEEDGELALGLAFTAQQGESDFVPMAEAPGADLAGELDPLLGRAAEMRDRIIAIRGLIPSQRARFTLSERAARNPQIVLTPEQWRVLLGVNGERDVVAIADHLRMRQLPAIMVLADLVRGGYLDVIPATEQTWPDVERRKTPWPPPAPAVAPPSAEEPPIPQPAPAETETPLAETPLEREPVADDRLAALSGLFGPAEPAPPPPAWEPPAAEGTTSPEAAAAAATAEAWQPPAPVAPPEPGTTDVDARLAALVPTAAPEAPAWVPPASVPEAPVEAPPPEAAVEPPPLETPVFAPTPGWPERRREDFPAAPPAPAAAIPEKRRLFGWLFGGAKAAPLAAAPIAPASTRPGQLASFANELLAAYNSGEYGKGRVEDRVLSLIMRADEQADPIDRPLPVANDRLDVGTIDRDGIPERQAVPYLAVLVRQIYDDAERALGKDKARRGFRDVRDRLFGKDLTLFRAPEVAGRMPKI